jgi:hypothetical protein
VRTEERETRTHCQRGSLFVYRSCHAEYKIDWGKETSESDTVGFSRQIWAFQYWTTGLVAQNANWPRLVLVSLRTLDKSL